MRKHEPQSLRKDKERQKDALRSAKEKARRKTRRRRTGQSSFTTPRHLRSPLLAVTLLIVTHRLDLLQLLNMIEIAHRCEIDKRLTIPLASLPIRYLQLTPINATLLLP